MEQKRQNRLKQIQKALIITFFMNLSVCVIKIILGLVTGILTITADGFHSLVDSASNIIGLMGIRLAQKEPDKKYAYGYDKFEPVVTLLIVSLISITCYKVLESGFERFFNPQTNRMYPIAFVLMFVSMAVNVVIIKYEGGVGKRLKSELLIADSNETKSDLWVSGGVIVSLFIIHTTGWWRADGLITFIIGLFIMKVIWDIVVPTSRILADAQVVDTEKVIAVALNVPGVRFCHAVRSHGRTEGFYLDLHLGVDKNLTVEKAHDGICHNVKIALFEKLPGLKAANIHIEPDNENGKNRGNSVFRESDPYEHK